jgi:CSLREA domain-containing protein
VGKDKILSTSTCLSAFVCWFLSGAFAQAATFTVNSPLDVADANPGNGICETAPGNGTCTLRAAIQETNALSGADAITLPPNTYVLTIVGELAITSRLTITGSGASTTIIDGNRSVRPNSRVLVVGSGIIVNITGVTIRNGGTTAVGGGIFNGGTLTLTNSTVSGNAAANDGGGIFNNGGIVTLVNSVVSGNNAGVDGGGIRNDPGGTVTLTNSTVSGNTAGDDAGGIHNVGGTLTLTNSMVSGNDSGDDGGGIRNSGTTNLFSSTIANNRAGLNSSPNNLGGGGVHNFGGTLTLTNSTVSGNVARTDGGGIFNETGTVNSFSSTIANNRADANSNGSGIGGGVFNLSQQGATFNFKNTIIANNQVGSNPNNIRDCAGTLTSQGYNLIRIRPQGECNVAPVTGDLFSSDPLLGPLQNNGGSTQTHALLAGSPAIDAGNPNVGCVDSTGTPLPTDQRGLLRAFDGNGDNSAVCDIGAFELNEPHPSPAISISDLSVSEGNSGTMSVNFQVTLSAPSSQPVTVTFSTSNGTAVGGTDYVSNSGTVTFNPGETSKTITVLVDGDTIVEGNETFFVNLTSATNGTITDGQGIGTIVDDDAARNVWLRNISTRSRVLTGDNIMIGGFIIDGSTPLRVLVRSRGPSMGGAPFFVPGTLANPLLRLFSGQTVIAQNDNWQDAPNCSGFPCEDAAHITSTGLDPCQPNPGQAGPPANCNLESAILVTLPPGAYTASVTGADGGTGVGLVEVFEMDDSVGFELSNISTRSFVQNGDNVMIGGLIIEGNTPATVLIRARGPSMSGAPFFVPGTLADPFLQLFSGQDVIAQNNNWQDAPTCTGFVCGNAAQIAATGLDPCQPNPGQTTSPPGCTQESAILITLPPGGYTAIISGVGGGTGVGLVEAFEISVP